MGKRLLSSIPPPRAPRPSPSAPRPTRLARSGDGPGWDAQSGGRARPEAWRARAPDRKGPLTKTTHAHAREERRAAFPLSLSLGQRPRALALAPGLSVCPPPPR